MPELIGSFLVLKVIAFLSLRRNGWRGVWDGWRGVWDGCEKVEKRLAGG